MTRREVFDILDDERRYQDTVWGPEHDVGYTLADWLGILTDRLCLAGMAEANNDQDTCLEQIRTITAVGVACMEYLNVPKRSI
jgi:hypothetical protein